MKKFTFLLTLSAFFTTVSFAQTPAPQAVGVVTRVEGLVTVGQNNTMGNVSKDNFILENARVATTANGSTTIRLNNGCVIDLKPNQAVTVDLRRECKAILASIQPAGAVVASGAGSGVGGAVGAGDAIISGSGILVTLEAIRALSRSNENSALQRLSGS